MATSQSMKALSRAVSKIDTVIYLHNGIGDLVMAFPCLEVLKQHAANPRRVLVWVKCTVTFELMRLAGYTDVFEVRILNRRWAPLQALALRLRRVEVVLAPQACGDWRMPLMAWMTGAAVRVGRENPLGRWGFNRVLRHYDRQRLHKSRFYLRVLAAASYPVPSDPRLPKVTPAEEHRRIARERSGTGAAHTLVVFAPGSSGGETHKRWPAHRYAELARAGLNAHPEWRIALFGGPEELPLMEEIRNSAGPEAAARIQIVAESRLGVALAVLAEARCVVTNCNGPAHMAALVGAPLVSVYGPTNPGNTGPFTSEIRVVREGFACSPCYRHEFLRGCGRADCMSAIAASTVLGEVERSLGGDRGNWADWQDTTAATTPQRHGSVPLYAP